MRDTAPPNPVSAALAVSADVAAGALEAGGEIAAAAVEMVQTATDTLASVAGAGLPERSTDDPADRDDRQKSRDEEERS